jgi:hypothetical protein
MGFSPNPGLLSVALLHALGAAKSFYNSIAAVSTVLFGQVLEYCLWLRSIYLALPKLF